MKIPFILRAVGAAAVAGLLTFFSAGLVAALRYKGLDSSEAAGWVQAIGATLGIGIAIWVPLKQKADADAASESARRDVERRVCLAFRDELTLLAGRFDGENVRDLLRDDASDEIFDRELPSPRQRFPIFNAMVGRITEIEDERIRRGLIEAYEAANSLIELTALNNRHLAEFSEMLRLPVAVDGRNHPDHVRHKEKMLISMRVQMQFVCRTTISKVHEVLPLLDAAARNPRLIG